MNVERTNAYFYAFNEQKINTSLLTKITYNEYIILFVNDKFKRLKRMLSLESINHHR